MAKQQKAQQWDDISDMEEVAYYERLAHSRPDQEPTLADQVDAGELTPEEAEEIRQQAADIQDPDGFGETIHRKPADSAEALDETDAEALVDLDEASRVANEDEDIESDASP